VHGAGMSTCMGCAERLYLHVVEQEPEFFHRDLLHWGIRGLLTMAKRAPASVLQAGARRIQRPIIRASRIVPCGAGFSPRLGGISIHGVIGIVCGRLHLPELQYTP